MERLIGEKVQLLNQKGLLYDKKIFYMYGMTEYLDGFNESKIPTQDTVFTVLDWFVHNGKDYLVCKSRTKMIFLIPYTSLIPFSWVSYEVMGIKNPNFLIVGRTNGWLRDLDTLMSDFCISYDKRFDILLEVIEETKHIPNTLKNEEKKYTIGWRKVMPLIDKKLGKAS